MGYSGMNAAIIDRVASDLIRCGNQLGDVSNQVDAIVARTQEAWSGDDARRFASDWQGDRGNLAGLSSALDALARQARSEARAQRLTSGE
ncbi:MAG: WXG100 family type VII secretion target [Propionibacteriaceae bacterium]|jgi:uncharacterized protein YukE|nr:WXG100 family type VII secretion target [Propionibacteriaceae bacterium]